MITNQQIIDAYKNFDQNGYDIKFLSYDENSNISLGKFRDFIIQKKPNFFDLTKKTGDYNGFKIEDIHNFIKRTQDKYYDFCCSVGLRYKEQKEDILHWYRGIIGEWFVVRVLLKNFSLTSVENNKSSLYKFSCPIPSQLISNEKYEFGTDCIAIGPNNVPVVFQIKFWSLYTGQIIKQDVINALHSDAIENDYIVPHQPESMWILWTGLKSKDVSLWIKKTPHFKHNMIKYIDRDDMNLTIKDNANLLSIWNTEVEKWK